VSALATTSDVDVGAVMLQVAGKKLGRVRVDQRLTDGRLERTMDGASTLTLTVDDTDRALITAGVFDKQIDVQLLGEWWRLVQVSKSGDTLTLTFEDRAVSYLRKQTKPRKAARSKMTRAQFALSLVREVKAGGGIKFVCPDLTAKQPIAKSSQKPTPASKAAPAGGQGISSAAGLTCKHAPASAEQRKNAERVLDVAASLNAGPRASLALLQACTQESGLKNLSYGMGGSTGILQVLASTGQGMGIDPRDVEACANVFLTRGFYADPQMGAGGAISKAGKYPSATTGRVAQAVQGSGHPTLYDQWQAEAQKWLAAYGGVTGGGSGSFDTTTTVPYQFQRGGTDGTVEDSWTCLQRLASEVGWRCFIVEGACYFVSETTLATAKPRATLSELTLGVDTIDFDVDNGKATSEATVTARIVRLGFPPGSVVVLDDVGPANGRWLVHTVARGVFDAQGTITLKRVTEPLPEPAASTTTTSTGSSQLGFGGAAGLGTATPDVDRAYQAAKAIDAKRYPYVWGGGHAHCGTPDRGTGRDPGIGFDCSGSTCAVLATAGMGYTLGGPADVSGTIAARWGAAGEGQYLTVWANAIHVWMEFKTSAGDQHFGTGDWGSDTGTGGPAFQARMHTKDGFTPRHWPGS
jgi:hypothetical protein